MTGAPSSAQPIPIVVVGAGAAGLMAAITAARTRSIAPPPPNLPGTSVLLLDGAKSIGAKLLVSGGGRCNVTHHTIDHRLYCPAADQPTIRQILRAFDVKQTVAFFNEINVELKQEPTGKLFPTTDKARTVLSALLRAAEQSGVAIRNPWRVAAISHDPAADRFTIRRAAPSSLTHPDPAPTPDNTILARRLILATGGRSLPKTGSDGQAHTIARALGHTITQPLFPALVPLTIDAPRDAAHLTELSGIATVATLEVRAATNKRLHAITASTLCTHFGLSGPGPMNISRHLAAARLADPGAHLLLNWLPNTTMDQLDAQLLHGARTPIATFLRTHPNANPLVGGFGGSGGLPTRLAETICRAASLDPATPAHDLRREQRKALARAATEMTPPISGDRGWNHAEVTAGGIPLSEIDPTTMRSRILPNLFLCGEIIDVDAPIGGYNFQWAWSTGHLAGKAAAHHAQ